jgi:hypothetical protein
MFADARRAGLTRTSETRAREDRRRALLIASIFLVSIPVALLEPHLAPYCWLALFIPTAGRIARRSPS